MRILWDFVNWKSIILRSTQYKVMVILVQGQFKAVSRQNEPIGNISVRSTVPMWILWCTLLGKINIEPY